MKQLLLAAALLATTGLAGYGQCEKKVVLSASKTEHLGADSSLQRTDDEATVIEFDKSTITVKPEHEGALTGKVNTVTCNWATPFKVGKTRMNVTLTNPEGESKNLTITIEGKAGKVIFLAEMDDMPDKKIRLVADKFEEKL